MFAFSTCWNASRHDDGEELVNEILLLGFESIEVSTDASPSLLPGLARAVEQGRVRVSGLQGMPFSGEPAKGASLISSDSAEFERAIRAALRSITQAAQLDAEYLILDLGDLGLTPTSPKLAEMAANGQLNNRDFVQKKIETIRRRESLSAVTVERLSEALDTLLPYAEEKKVSISLPINCLYEGFPSPRELEVLLKTQNSSAFGYWHDFSASQMQANLDYLDHQELLEAMTSRTSGAHLNDCTWPSQGKLAPGQGEIEFSHLLQLIPSGAPTVWAVNSKCKTDDIKHSFRAFQADYF